jgi:hypothetical protein
VWAKLLLKALFFQPDKVALNQYHKARYDDEGQH